MKGFAVLANAFLTIAALSLGSLLARWIPPRFSRLDRLSLSLLGGIGLLGTLLFCVGQIRFTRSVILLVLCSCVLLGFRTFTRVARSWWPSPSPVAWPILPAAIVISVLAVSAVAGLSLPVGDMNNDSIAYHYLGPSVWLRQGIIRPVADEVLTYFPVLVETQYAALISLGGDRAPGFFAMVSLGALCLVAACLGIRLELGAVGAWWVAALVAAMPAVYAGAAGGMVDALFAAFVLCAARIAFDAERPRDFALFGMFCGFAAATKYTGIISAAILIFCVVVVRLWTGRRSAGNFLGAIAISSTIALLFASPFYLRNWILYGCPIYPPPPALLHFFRPKNISPVIMQRLVTNVVETGAGMGRGVKHFLLLPFNLTYHTANFRGAGGIGLVPWALAPFGLISRWREPFSSGIALFAVLQLTSWFMTAQVSRYLIASYVIAAILGVLGWQSVAASRRRSGIVLCSIVLAVSVSYGLFMILSGQQDDLHAALSRKFEDARTLRETSWAESFRYLNNDPSVTKVLILDENVAPYFLKMDYVKPFGRWGERTVPDVAGPSDLLSVLPRLHVTHVLDVRFPGGSFMLPEHPPGLMPAFERGNQIVYRVQAPSQ